jgi:tetratricopeptide (TPR) repeat protein
MDMTDINRLKNEARRHEQREQWPRAIELYSKAIDAIEARGFGTDLSLYNRVGDLYLRQGDTARAVSFYERAIDRYAEQGLQTSAVALCNKVLRIAPGRSEIYRTLGRLHAETGLQAQARRSFMEYASRMERTGELAAAVEALEEFVKLSADEEARISLGRYLIAQDRVPEGLSHLRQVLAERSERGEDCAEVVALIEQVEPGSASAESAPGAGHSDETEDSMQAEVAEPDPSAEVTALPEEAAESPEADVSGLAEGVAEPDVSAEVTAPAASALPEEAAESPEADVSGLAEGVAEPDVSAEVTAPAASALPEEAAESPEADGSGLLQEVPELAASSETEISTDAVESEAEPAPSFSEAAAAELDQILADLSEAGVDAVAEELVEVGAGLASLPDADHARTRDQGDTTAPAGEVTLGASITADDSTLHDLLAELQSRVDATVRDTDSAAHYDLGIAYKEMGLLDEAIEEFGIAIRHDRQLLGAHQLLAESLIQEGRYEEGVGAMAEFLRAVQPRTDVDGQMERMSELLRASPSDETLTELTHLLRSLAESGPVSREAAHESTESLDGLSIDELFPDLEEAWESVVGETVDTDALPEEIESQREGSGYADVEPFEVEAELAAQTDAVAPDAAEVEAAPPQYEEAGTDSADSEEDIAAQIAPVEEIPEAETAEEPVGDTDPEVLEQLSESLAEPTDSWSGTTAPWLEPGEPWTEGTGVEPAAWEPVEQAPRPEWPGDDRSEGAEVSGDRQEDIPAEAEWDSEPVQDTQPATVPDVEAVEADVEPVPESVEADVEPVPEAVEADVDPVAESVGDKASSELQTTPGDSTSSESAATGSSEELGNLLFGARLAKFRARMARSASETDFQAHYDLGLAYKEVALYDEAIAELLVAVTGPEAVSRKALRLMNEVADLADDEELRLTAADRLHEHGMSAEALEQLWSVYEGRVARGGDTEEIRRRMNAIDPEYVPPAETRIPESATERREAEGAELESIPADGSADVAAEAAGLADASPLSEEFEAVLRDLADAPPDPGSMPLVSEVAPDTAETDGSHDSSQPASAGDGEGDESSLSAWERRAAELLESGQRDEAIRELYRLQAAYEAEGDIAGAMRVVSSLLLLNPEDVILHHQNVEYAFMLDDRTVLALAHLDLGRCLQRQGAAANARSTFARVLEIDPDNEEAQRAIAEIDALEVEEEDRAQGMSAGPGDPIDYETHYELGLAFKQDGLHEEAIYELEIAARGLEDPVPAYELLGELFNEAEQHETGARVLAGALEADGRSDVELIGVLYQLGVSHQALGNAAPAADCFRRVLEVDSGYRDAADRLDSLSL